MNCPDCTNYNRSKGNKKCLTCPQYQDIIKTSGKRSTINIDTIPDIILDAIPDNKTTSIYDALRQIPLSLSVPLLAYHVLNANQRELAVYFKCSQQQLSKNLIKAVELIKKIPINE